MHNVFEMGFDILQRDGHFAAGIAAAQSKGEISEDHAAMLEDYMSTHHADEPHNIEALQKHLTESHILTEAHAPVHDMLRSAGLIKEEVDYHLPAHYDSHHHHGDKHYEAHHKPAHTHHHDEH